MSDLDDKLREILLQADVRRDERRSNTDDTIKEIKQAFIDENPETAREYSQRIAGPNLNQPSSVMTGQEWFDRFEKEFEKAHNGMPLTSMEETMRAAAQRAAGIKKD